MIKFIYIKPGGPEMKIKCKNPDRCRTCPFRNETEVGTICNLKNPYGKVILIKILKKGGKHELQNLQ